MKTGAQIQAEILEKAAEDTEFRSRLVADPMLGCRMIRC